MTKRNASPQIPKLRKVSSAIPSSDSRALTLLRIVGVVSEIRKDQKLAELI